MHTPDERALFRVLAKRPNGPFSGPRQPNWVVVAQEWSTYCDGRTLYYKLPEHLKSYYKIWLDYRNEENSVEQYKAACDQIKRLLVPCISSMPPIPVYPRTTLNNELRPASHGSSLNPSHAEAAPSSSSSTSDWHIGVMLGQISMQQTSVQYPYFEGPPGHSTGGRTATKRKHTASGTVKFASPVVIQDSGEAPTPTNRKIRTCKRCKQRNCEGIFLSRPCKPMQQKKKQ